VARLRLVPIETVPTGAHQQSLWGGSGAEDERAHRALARVQTLLGHGSVLAPVLDGGRDPAQRTRLVPWGDAPVAIGSPQQPWPGLLPAPAPSVLLDPPRAAQVLDGSGRSVVVTERGAMPAPPALFALGSEKPVSITSWAGPWPVDERWWSEAARSVVRCQLVDVRGRAYLVSGTMPEGVWQVDAIYD
jgi:protein ImuB